MKEPLKIKVPPTLEQQHLLVSLEREAAVLHALSDSAFSAPEFICAHTAISELRLLAIDIARIRVSALEQKIMALEACR